MRTELGRLAEDRAAAYLREQGYTVVTRRYRAAGGEVDLIALDGDALVMVEVKAAYAPGSRPEEALGARKLGALRKAGMAYVAAVGEPDRGFRIDLIAIGTDGLRHHRDVGGV